MTKKIKFIPGEKKKQPLPFGIIYFTFKIESLRIE